MNLHTCEGCPATSTPADQLKSDLDTYERLLPKGGIAQLFLSNYCQLCKQQPAGERRGYAFLFMGHPEPKRLQKGLFSRFFPKGFGTMVPLQVSCCKGCRRRLLTATYLPMAVPVLFGLAGLILILIQPVREAIASVASWLPLVGWLVLVLLGWLIGKLYVRKYCEKNSSKTYMDILTQPVIAEMIRMGWEPIGKKGKADVAFSKSRRARGLGTASPEDIPEDVD